MTDGGFRHVALGDVGSTNDEARARLALLGDGAFVVTGARQLAGRGRRGRNWVSPKGNLYASFCFRPDASLARLPELSFVAALAVCDTARAVTGKQDRFRCKWPNDVLAGDAKICGILLETAALDDGNYAVIAGIGVNVASHPTDTPYPSSALALEGFDGPLDEVLETMSRQLEHWITVWLGEGFASIRSAWLERASGLGKPLVARLPDRAFSGIFAGLADDGALMLETEAAGMLRIAAADVFRPGQLQRDADHASGH